MRPVKEGKHIFDQFLIAWLPLIDVFNGSVVLASLRKPEGGLADEAEEEENVRADIQHFFEVFPDARVIHH